MMRTFLLSKLHGAIVTGADLNYEGSFGIDSEIMDAADIKPNEQIHIYNVTNGKRFVTYAIPTEHGLRGISANGACARLVSIGDKVIICTYAVLEKKHYDSFLPKILLLDEFNNFSCKES